MNEKEYKELLEEVKSIRNQISRLSERLEFYGVLLRRYSFPHFLPLHKKGWREYMPEEGIPVNEWIKSHKKEIVSTSEIFHEYDISPQDATLHFLMKLKDMSTFLASKSLLGSCECGGQLQLLVKDNTVYLTCAKCGRWLWQGLKHE